MEKNKCLPHASACNTAERKSMAAEEQQIKELIRIGEAVPLLSLGTLYRNNFGSDDFVGAVGMLYAYAKANNVRLTFSLGSGTTLLDTKIMNEGIFYKDVKNAKLVYDHINTRNVVRRALDSELPDWHVEQNFLHSTGNDELYVAKRLGPSKENPIAVLRVSQQKHF